MARILAHKHEDPIRRAGRALAVRLVLAVQLPDSVGAVRVPRRAGEKGMPRDDAHDVVVAGAENALVADFGVDRRHSRYRRARTAEKVDGRADAAAVAV